MPAREREREGEKRRGIRGKKPITTSENGTGVHEFNEARAEFIAAAVCDLPNPLL